MGTNFNGSDVHIERNMEEFDNMRNRNHSPNARIDEEYEVLADLPDNRRTDHMQDGEVNVVNKSPNSSDENLDGREFNVEMRRKDKTGKESKELKMQNRNSSDFEYLEDDGQSSICSENIYSEYLSLPTDASSKFCTWERNSKLRRKDRESLVEMLEKQRRESVGNRLKELHMPNKRHSLSSSTSEMPIIAKARPLRGDALLPKQIRRSSYQSVLLTPFFSKTIKTPFSSFGQEVRDRRSYLASPRVQTPTSWNYDNRFFPLRETESLSCLEQFADTHDYPMRTTVALRQPMQDSEAVDLKDSTRLQRLQIEKQISKLGAVDYPFQSRSSSECSLQETAEGTPEEKHTPNQSDDVFKTNDEETRVIKSALPNDEPSSPYAVSSDVISATKASLPVPSAEVPHSVEVEEQYKAEKTSNGHANGQYEDDITQPVVSSISSFEKYKSTSPIYDTKEDRSSLILSSISEKLEKKRPSPEMISPAKDVTIPETSFKTERSEKVDFSNSRRDPEMKVTDQKKSYERENDALYGSVSRKFFSDIKIQLKEPEAIYPRNYNGITLPAERSSQPNAVVNHEDSLPSGSGPAPVDDDSSDSDVDGPPLVAPNWNSYPGILPEDYQQTNGPNSSTESPKAKSFFDAATTSSTPKRSVSTLEICLQPVSVDSPKKTTLDYSPTSSATSTPYLSRYASSSSIEVGSNTGKQMSTRISLTGNNRESNHESGLKTTSNILTGNDPSQVKVEKSQVKVERTQKSIDRKEIFLSDSSLTNGKTFTLPRDARSRSSAQYQQPTGRHSAYTSNSREQIVIPQRTEVKLNSRTKTAEDETENTPRGVSVEMMASNAIGTKGTSGDKAWSSSEPRKKISYFEEVWKSPIRKKENERKDERVDTRENGRNIEKTPSVERIWESLEESRPKLLKRVNRLESDPGYRSEIIVNHHRHHNHQKNRIVNDDEGRGSSSYEINPTTRSSWNQTSYGSGNYENPEGDCLLEIEVPKGGLGLGFCIEGGKDGPYGDRPITVKRLFRGSSDPKSPDGPKESLRAGDEILSANGRDMTLLSRFVAWNYLKTLPEGVMRLVIRRRSMQRPPYPIHVE